MILFLLVYLILYCQWQVMPVTSPARRRLDNVNGSSNPSTSPRRKRTRVEGPEASAVQSIQPITTISPQLLETTSISNSTIQDGDTNFPGDGAGATTCSRAVLDDSASTPATNSNSLHISLLADIQHSAHLNRLALQKQMTEGKGTEDAYPRHIKNYEAFWMKDQERRAKENPNHCRISAHPIVGEKVAIFLEHERTRNKVPISHHCYYIYHLMIFLA